MQFCLVYKLVCVNMIPINTRWLNANKYSFTKKNFSIKAFFFPLILQFPKPNHLSFFFAFAVEWTATNTRLLILLQIRDTRHTNVMTSIRINVTTSWPSFPTGFPSPFFSKSWIAALCRFESASETRLVGNNEWKAVALIASARTVWRHSRIADDDQEGLYRRHRRFMTLRHSPHDRRDVSRGGLGKGGISECECACVSR